MEALSMRELPKGWVWTRLGDVAETVTGTTPPKNDISNYGNFIPFVKPPELRDCVVSAAEDNLSEKGAKLARILPTNAVLVSCIGNLGKTGINSIPVAFNQQINAAIFPTQIVPKYGFYYLQTVSSILKELASATTVTIVNKSKFNTIPLPLSPLPEQHRIVAMIEKLFTRLDAGVETLRKIQLQLERYRQSVLESAFSGELTVEWRKAHKGELEPASVVLERIKTECKQNGKYKEPPPLDTSDLLELPEGWMWVRISDVADVNPKIVCELPSKLEVSFLPMRCVEEMTGKIDLSITRSYEEVRKGYTHFQEGDVLFAKITPCMENGKVAIASGLKNGIGFGSTEFHVIRHFDQIPSRIFFFYLIQDEFRKDAQRKMTGTAGQLRVPAKYLSEAVFPLPPLLEQHKIIDEIECSFSVADEIANSIEQSLKQSDRLRQSILKMAFEGKLVPQNPDDEPADKLLERIKAEKTRINTKQGRAVYGK